MGFTTELQKSKRHHDLVTIKRDRFEADRLDAIVIGFSRSVVVVHSFRDFYYDGIILIRRADISSVYFSKTNAVQTRILEDDGVLDSIDFKCQPAVSSIHEFVSWIPSDELAMIYQESRVEPLFFLGTLEHVHETYVLGRSLTGAGRWESEPRKIELDQITCCQLRSNYSNAYSRHLRRLDAEISK